MPDKSANPMRQDVMPKYPRMSLVEPLFSMDSDAAASRHGAPRCNSMAPVMFLAVVIGLGYGMVLSSVPSTRGGGGEVRETAQGSPMNMIGGFMPPGRARQFMQPTAVSQPTKVWQFLQPMGPARLGRFMEPMRARPLEKGGMSGEVDFQAWGDLAKLGSGKTVVPDTPSRLDFEDGGEYVPYVPGQDEGGSADTAKEPGVPGTGFIVNWLSDKGFGFIKPADGGPDLYAHVSELVDGDGSVKRGDPVTYMKTFNKRRGKDQAEEVKLDPEGTPQAPPVEKREAGKLMKWNTEKGYGFIKPSGGGDDVFCHVSSLAGGEGSVKEGDEVTYVKNLDKRRQKIRSLDVKPATEEDLKAIAEAAAAEEAAPPAEPVAEAAEETPPAEPVAEAAEEAPPSEGQDAA